MREQKQTLKKARKAVAQSLPSGDTPPPSLRGGRRKHLLHLKGGASPFRRVRQGEPLGTGKELGYR